MARGHIPAREGEGPHDRFLREQAEAWRAEDRQAERELDAGTDRRTRAVEQP